MQDWYGADFNKVNRLLAAGEAGLSSSQWTERARAYRDVLSLLLALGEPTSDLVCREDRLEAQVNRYLRALARAGIVSSRLRDAALQNKQRPQPHLQVKAPESFTAGKGPNAIRIGSRAYGGDRQRLCS
jgi:hypothetical protein